MAGNIGVVSLKGIVHDEWHYPFKLASGIVAADVGKAVALDATAANTVKLAGDGDAIVGRLETVESRAVEGLLVGTVALKGGMKFPVKSGETVIVGDRIVGAGAGEVKAVGTAVADIALSTSNTYTDAAVNTAVNAAIAEINAALNAHRNMVVEVGTGFCIAVVV